MIGVFIINGGAIVSSTRGKTFVSNLFLSFFLQNVSREANRVQ